MSILALLRMSNHDQRIDLRVQCLRLTCHDQHVRLFADTLNFVSQRIHACLLVSCHVHRKRMYASLVS